VIESAVDFISILLAIGFEYYHHHFHDFSQSLAGAATNTIFVAKNT